MSEIRQVNQMRVTGSLASPCRSCDNEMDPKRAWWWTWHGATCSESCADQLVEHRHADQKCTEDCR